MVSHGFNQHFVYCEWDRAWRLGLFLHSKNYLLVFVILKFLRNWGGLEDLPRLIKGSWAKGSLGAPPEVEMMILAGRDLSETDTNCPIKCSRIFSLKSRAYRQNCVPPYPSLNSSHNYFAILHCSHLGSMLGFLFNFIKVPTIIYILPFLSSSSLLIA